MEFLVVSIELLAFLVLMGILRVKLHASFYHCLESKARACRFLVSSWINTNRYATQTVLNKPHQKSMNRIMMMSVWNSHNEIIMTNAVILISSQWHHFDVIMMISFWYHHTDIWWDHRPRSLVNMIHDQEFQDPIRRLSAALYATMKGNYRVSTSETISALCLLTE